MKRDYSIDTLRTISMFLVILLHISANYVLEKKYQDEYDTAFWVSNLTDSFTRICVPLFVLISGMFLIGKNENFKDFYKKRASRILLPLVFWSIAYIIFEIIFQFISRDSIDYISILESLILGRPYYHLWYVYMIIGLYLFVPVLNLVVSKIKAKTLWRVAIFFLLFGMFNYTYNFFLGNKTLFILWFLNYLGYFILGYLLRDYNYKYSYASLIMGYLISSLLISVFSYYTMRYFDNSYFYGNLTPLVITGSLCIYILFQKLNLKSNKLSSMSHLTFGIYLVHAGIIVSLDSVLKIFNITIFNNPLYGIPSKFIVVSLFSILVSYCFSKNWFTKKFI